MHIDLSSLHRYILFRNRDTWQRKKLTIRPACNMSSHTSASVTLSSRLPMYTVASLSCSQCRAPDIMRVRLLGRSKRLRSCGVGGSLNGNRRRRRDKRRTRLPRRQPTSGQTHILSLVPSENLQENTLLTRTKARGPNILHVDMRRTKYDDYFRDGTSDILSCGVLVAWV
jgi:hypothetical protein